MASRDHAHGDESCLGMNAQEALRSCGLKVTKARLAIFEILTREHGPFTAEELFVRLSSGKLAVACDLVTIYRCLSKFERHDLINRCDFGDGLVRYELRATKHHHHIICRKCKRIESLHTCPVEDRSIKMPNIAFKDISHRLEFFGICHDCHGYRA